MQNILRAQMILHSNSPPPSPSGRKSAFDKLQKSKIRVLNDNFDEEPLAEDIISCAPSSTKLFPRPGRRVQPGGGDFLEDLGKFRKKKFFLCYFRGLAYLRLKLAPRGLDSGPAVRSDRHTQTQSTQRLNNRIPSWAAQNQIWAALMSVRQNVSWVQ